MKGTKWKQKLEHSLEIVNEEKKISYNKIDKKNEVLNLNYNNVI